MSPVCEYTICTGRRALAGAVLRMRRSSSSVIRALDGARYAIVALPAPIPDNAFENRCLRSEADDSDGRAQVPKRAIVVRHYSSSPPPYNWTRGLEQLDLCDRVTADLQEGQGGIPDRRLHRLAVAWRFRYALV